jgi:hypothetical protein
MPKHCKVDGPSIPEIIKIQPFNHKLWKNWFSEVGQCNFTAAKKAFFLPFRDTKRFAMKMTNHHDKQLTPSESWDQDGFFEHGFGYHQLQIIGLEVLQRCGHQIRVNTWTCSYAVPSLCFSTCHFHLDA